MEDEVSTGMCSYFAYLITPTNCFVAVESVNQSDDRGLLKLAITYGVLRRLCFEEEVVQECLQKSPGTELDQALDWVRNSLSISPNVRTG